MSKRFWIALALIFACFAGYETALNLWLRRMNDQALAACIRVDTSQYIQARE